MSLMQAELYDALKEIGVKEPAARNAALAAAKSEGEITMLRWMIGVVIVLQIAIFVKEFFP